MNARSFRVKLNLTPLDFPAITDLGQSLLNHKTEMPRMNNNKVVLNITKYYVLVDIDNKSHEILSAQSIYEIPTTQIKSREDVYEFYKDAVLVLNEAYQFAGTQLTTLHKITLPTPPIEDYEAEINRVSNLIISRN